MSIATRVLCLATLILAFSSAIHAQKETTKQYIVIPDSWITANGSRPATSAPSGGQAYVFPSFADGLLTTDDVKISGLFTDFKHFKGSQTKDWHSSRNKHATLTVERMGNDAKITLLPNEIRSLDFRELRRLQKSFKAWLCNKGTTWFSQGCNVAYSDLDAKLLAFWKDEKVLPTFATFAEDHLNAPAIGIVAPGRAQMYMQEIDPGMMIEVIWGNQNLNAQASYQNSYTRITSGGDTRLTVSQGSDKNLHLFPQGTPLFETVSQQSSFNTDIPYPGKSKALFTTNHAMTVNNEFDLYHRELLTTCPGRDSATKECVGSKPPAHLFLLYPYRYSKPDSTSSAARFENEAVPDDQAVGDPVSSDFLAYQYVVIACGSAEVDVEAEWKNLLKIAATGQDSQIKESCSAYKQALFTTKTSVHLRDHYSINGQPMPDGAANLETVGQVVGSAFGARADKTSASPLLEVWRNASVTRGLSADRKHISFYTTNGAVLNQLAVREGDEIYVRSIPEALR